MPSSKRTHSLNFSPTTELARPWIEKRKPANQHGPASSSHILDITLVACGILQGSATISARISSGKTGNLTPHRFIPGALVCQVVVDPERMTVSRSRLVTGRGMMCALADRLSGCLRDRFIGRRMPPLSSTPGGDWRCVGTTGEPSPRYAQWFSHGIA